MPTLLPVVALPPSPESLILEKMKPVIADLTDVGAQIVELSQPVPVGDIWITHLSYRLDNELCLTQHQFKRVDESTVHWVRTEANPDSSTWIQSENRLTA